MRCRRMVGKQSGSSRANRSEHDVVIPLWRCYRVVMEDVRVSEALSLQQARAGGSSLPYAE